MTVTDSQDWTNYKLCPGAEPAPGYRLVQRLGGGGSGEVWKAEALGGFRVALKFVPLATSGIHDKGGGQTSEVEERALRIIQNVHHPNLLVTFGAWKTRGFLVIAMELADRTLWDRFLEAAEQKLPGVPREELLEYFVEAAKGIDHLNGHTHVLDGKHKVAVQHRDIKPQNILLVGGGVKVGDFGLARLLENSVTGHTGLLTPAYAAPEFFKGETSSQSDQYSLAITYCQLRSGRLPFTGKVAQMMAGHMMRPPDLSMLPEDERPIVGRALAKEPAQRWPNCRAFVKALKMSRPAKLTQRAPPSPPSPPSPPAPTAPPPPVVAPDYKTALPFQTASVPPARDGSTKRPAVAPPPPPKAAPPPVKPVPKRAKKPNWEQIIADCSEAIQLDPDYAAAYRDRGDAYRRQGKHDLAITDYDQVVRLVPNDAVVYRSRGLAHHARGRYENAIADYTRAVQLDAHFAAAYANRARAYGDLGLFDEALADGDAAVLLNPRLAVAYHYRGWIYHEMGEYHLAIADYDQAVRLDPRDPVAYHNRGYAYYKKGAIDEAIADYTKAIELSPTDARTFRNRGDAYEDKGVYPRAIADYTEAVRLDARYASAYNGRGFAYSGLGDYAKAIADFDEAIQINPEHPVYYQNRAYAHAALGDEGRARLDQMRAEHLLPQLNAASPR